MFKEQLPTYNMHDRVEPTGMVACTHGADSILRKAPEFILLRMFLGMQEDLEPVSIDPIDELRRCDRASADPGDSILPWSDRGVLLIRSFVVSAVMEVCTSKVMGEAIGLGMRWQLVKHMQANANLGKDKYDGLRKLYRDYLRKAECLSQKTMWSNIATELAQEIPCACLQFANPVAGKFTDKVLHYLELAQFRLPVPVCLGGQLVISPVLQSFADEVEEFCDRNIMLHESSGIKEATCFLENPHAMSQILCVLEFYHGLRWRLNGTMVLKLIGQLLHAWFFSMQSSKVFARALVEHGAVDKVLAILDSVRTPVQFEELKFHFVANILSSIIPTGNYFSASQTLQLFDGIEAFFDLVEHSDAKPIQDRAEELHYSFSFLFETLRAKNDEGSVLDAFMLLRPALQSVVSGTENAGTSFSRPRRSLPMLVLALTSSFVEQGGHDEENFGQYVVSAALDIFVFLLDAGVDIFSCVDAFVYDGNAVGYRRMSFQEHLAFLEPSIKLMHTKFCSRNGPKQLEMLLGRAPVEALYCRINDKKARDPKASIFKKKVCQVCNGTSPAMKQCPCKVIYYCSVECQKTDWKRHKMHCSARVANKEALCVTRTTLSDRTDLARDRDKMEFLSDAINLKLASRRSA